LIDLSTGALYIVPDELHLINLSLPQYLKSLNRCDSNNKLQEVSELMYILGVIEEEAAGCQPRCIMSTNDLS